MCNVDKSLLFDILNVYSSSFIDRIPKSRVTTGQLDIRLVDSNIDVQRRYGLSSDEKEIVRNMIKELLESNIIRTSCSPFANLILLVKKNGTDLLCVDYRELNSNTVADKYTLPLISDRGYAEQGIFHVWIWQVGFTRYQFIQTRLSVQPLLLQKVNTSF